MPFVEKNISGADGVRAIACLAVFIRHIYHHWGVPAHWPLSQWLARLEIGVGIFFVLSGMLLSMPFWRSFRTGRQLPSLRVYAIRRAARIIPAYYLCLLVSFILLQPWDVENGLILAAALTFTNSFFPWSYFPVEVNFALWSIGVEVIFYVLLAGWFAGLFLLRGRVHGLVYWVATIGLIILVHIPLLKAYPDLLSLMQDDALPRQVEAARWLPGKNPIGLFVHFLFGVLGGWLILALDSRLAGKQTSGELPGFRRFDGLVLLILAATAFVFFAKELAIAPGIWRLAMPVHNARWEPVGYDWPLFPLCIMLLLAALPFTRYMARLFDNRLFRLTGKLSYGIYLWHMLVIPVLGKIWPDVADASISARVGFTALALALSYLVAWVSFQWLERPIVDWGNRLTGKPASPPPAQLSTPSAK